MSKELVRREGWLRHLVAARVQTQFSPRLEFIRDTEEDPLVLEKLFEKLDIEKLDIEDRHRIAEEKAQQITVVGLAHTSSPNNNNPEQATKNDKLM